MRAARTPVVIAFTLCVGVAHAAPTVLSFDGDTVDAPPSGMSFGRTGPGRPGRWVVQAAKDAPSDGKVLAQLDTDDTDGRFALAVADAPVATDLTLSVKCKPVAGKVDRACGLVWRYQDEKNYYLARANALEANVRIYFVKDGVRRQIESAREKVASGAWQELRVEAAGDHFRVSWNGKQVLDVHDRTFAAAGKAGLWTKADSVTQFDDLTIDAAGGGAPAPKGGLDTPRIEKLTGARGQQDGDVFKVSLPRKDLAVTVGKSVTMTPPLGLTCWAAFGGAGAHTMVMGDLVLLEDQVNPVMSAALEAGLEVTALHNHFFWDTPKVMFMHIAGMGDEAALATAVGKVFARIEATAGGKGEVPRATVDPARSSLDPKKIDAVLGTTGAYKDGVYKATFGRKTQMGGGTAGKAMGVNTWAAFAGSDDKAIVDGDFAMLEGELQDVLKALRQHGLYVVAIHNHMTGETPRILFLHYWGAGSTADLARGVKAALDKTEHDR